MKTITVTVYRRPTLFRRLLESLAANDLSQWHVCAQIKPSPAAGEFGAALCHILHGRRFAAMANTERLGVRLSPFTLPDDDSACCAPPDAQRAVCHRDWAQAAIIYRQVFTLTSRQSTLWVQYSEVLERRAPPALAQAAHHEADAINSAVPEK